MFSEAQCAKKQRNGRPNGRDEAHRVLTFDRILSMMRPQYSLCDYFWLVVVLVLVVRHQLINNSMELNVIHK